jgi:hypothetical protein
MTVRRRNRINQQFSARLIEMLECPAYRALSRSAHLVISRIEVELAHHGGNDNGRLPVTTDNFVAYGIHRASVAPAIREVEALGFIRVTERGRGGNAEHRSPNYFFLTFAYAKAEPPTHKWRQIKTVEEAAQIAHAARADKNSRAVALGKRSWGKRQRTGQKTVPGNNKTRFGKPVPETSVFGSENRYRKPVRKTGITAPVQKPVLLSKVWGREEL